MSDTENIISANGEEPTTLENMYKQSIENTSKKPFIVLDLDLTLIHAVSASDIEKKYPDKSVMAAKLSSLKLHDMKEGNKSYYLVFERPGLQEFLDYLFENFRVIVWTAATKSYAAFIIEKIILQKQTRDLEYAFVHYHCKRSKKRYGANNPKNLIMLMDKYKIQGMNRKNTIIIDDHPDVKAKNHTMCIPAPEFLALNEDTLNPIQEAPNDDFLPKLKTKLNAYIEAYRKNGGVEDVNKFI
jgi:TFIIF-interacting CTD phosphatase-like protein